MKYLLSTLTDMALMKQKLKESSEDETKTQNTTDGRYVVRATGAQVSEGNDTYINITALTSSFLSPLPFVLLLLPHLLQLDGTTTRAYIWLT